ncbi:MAG: aldo/keto reductase [Myxococcota bacterium]
MTIEYRPYGGSGLRVSRYCLGAMMFGAMGNRDEGECIRIVHAALDAGVNFVDTADAYSSGESERILAKALSGRRDRVVLATKCFFPTGRDVNEGGGSRRWIVRAVEESLRRLETDWIDVYQLHRRDPLTDLEESLEAMHTLREQGKIRVVGTSATPYRRGAEALEGSRSLGFWNRTGRWDAERAEVQRKYDLVGALEALAKEAGLPLPHLAMAFASEHPGVSSAIVGPRTFAQAEELLRGLEVTLTPELLDRIDALAAPGGDLDPRDTSVSVPALEDVRERRRPR